MRSHFKLRRTFAWAALTLAAGIFLSLAAAWRQSSLNATHVQASTNAAAELFADDITSAIELYDYGLRGARGIAVTGGIDGVRRDVFRRYTESRDLRREFPGALGFGLIQIVRAEDQDRFVQDARRDGWPDFAIRQLTPHEGDRYVIKFIEPVARNAPAVGLDIASESSRRTAAESSLRSGTATLTAPITLVQGPSEGSQSFLLLLPIYESPAAPPSVAEREQTAVGWSYAPLTMSDVFTHIAVDPSDFFLTVTDVTDQNAPAQFYAIGNAENPSALASSDVERTVFGRQWRITVGVLPAFVARLNQFSPMSALWIGLAASLMSATLVAQLNVSRQRQRDHIATQGRLAAIVNNSSDPIVGQNLDGRILSWNAAAERMFGYTAEEAVGRVLTDIVIPGDRRQEDADLLARIGRGETVEAFETIRLAKGGSPIDVAISTTAIRDPSGQIVGAAKLLRDLRGHRAEQRRQQQFAKDLERRVAQQTAELRSVNTLLEGVLRAASETSIIVTDIDGTIRIFNEGAEFMLGYSADEVIGKHTPALIHVAEEVTARGRQLSEEYGEAVSGFRVFVCIPERSGSERREWTYVRKDGTLLTVSLFVTVMHDEAGAVSGYLGIAEDITARKQTMAALQSARIAADAANAAKSKFLAMMSHELRTPMVGILGVADLLLSSSLNAEQENLLRTQVQSANSLLELLNEILDFAKIESGRLEPESFHFDLAATVEEVGATAALMAMERGNTMQIDAPAHLMPAFFGGGRRYRQVLINLIGNAIKFTANGKIHIKLEQKPLTQTLYEISTTVEDEGVGISPEALTQLFNPFIQEDVSTSRKFGGTGLGLAISKQLVQSMGGRIWVESEKGVGSTFGFTVELELGDPAKVESSASPYHRASLSGIALPVAARPLRILLAEDNATNRTLLVTLLSRMGHDVKAVENGALAADAALTARFDIVLMDMQMPVMDGPAAVRVIREAAAPIAQIPIIALTADALPDNQRRYIAEGVNAVVTKPVNWRHLATEMNRLTGPAGASFPEPVISSTATTTGSPPILDEETVASMAELLGLQAFSPMIDSFIASLTQLEAELRQNMSDLPAAKRTIHSLKGVSAQLGAMRLSDFARRMESEDRTSEDVRKKLPALQALIAETALEFTAWRSGAARNPGP